MSTAVRAETPPRTARIRILAIEDRADVLLPIVRVLRHALEGVEVVGIGDVDTFRVALEYGLWDALIVDPANRRCGAGHVLEVLAEDDLAVPVVLHTDAVDRIDRALAERAFACVPRGAPTLLIEAVQRATSARPSGRGHRRDDAAAAAVVDVRALAASVLDTCAAVHAYLRHHPATAPVEPEVRGALLALESACDLGAGLLAECGELLRPPPLGGWALGAR